MKNGATSEIRKTWPQPGKSSVRTDDTCFHSSALSSVHAARFLPLCFVSFTYAQVGAFPEYAGLGSSLHTWRIGTFISADPLKLCRPGWGPLVAISWVD